MDVPEVRFVDVDGIAIAWEQFGDGPDVLMIPPLASNIELVWEHPVFRRYLEYLARHVRVTAFDKGGIGSSDRFETAPTLEQRTEHVMAVMDAAGLRSASLFGVSEGGLMAQHVAVVHPERVERLVLLNSGCGTTGLRTAMEREGVARSVLREHYQRLVEMAEMWGRDPQRMADLFLPSRAGDAAFVRWLGRMQRQTATAADLQRQLASLLSLDPTSDLGRITAPTLIMYAVDDAVMLPAGSRYLAERIAGAELVELPGADHMAEVGERWQDVADRWLRFVTGTAPSQRTQRQLMTVVFTDIVGSSASTVSVGDRAWRTQLDEHDRSAVELATEQAGRVVKSMGDGILARFDTPRDALRFAVRLRDRVALLGLTLRVGVHTGEVELLDDGDLVGAAVNLAARVEQAADPGRIVVSSTVRDLLLGSDIRFVDRGEHVLKGFDAPWRLFELADLAG